MIFTRRSSGIFAPDREPIEVAGIHTGVQSSCVARLLRAKSGTLLREWRFRNTLNNALLNSWGQNTSGFPGVGLEVDGSNWFAAGTGITPPSAADTQLVTEIATGGRGSTTLITATYVAAVGAVPDYWHYMRRTTFGTGQANGTIGEFGWFGASSGNVPIRARAVPKDTTGAQTTIVKTSAATLVLEWNIRFIPIQADVILNRTIGGVAYTITGRALGCDAAFPAGFYFMSRAPAWGSGSGALGSRTQAALLARTGHAIGGTDVVVASLDAYVANSYQRTINFTTQAMASMAFLTNAGGTSGDSYCPWQLGFSPSTPAGQPLKVTVSWAPLP